jgi:hypothetical protein
VELEFKVLGGGQLWEMDGRVLGGQIVWIWTAQIWGAICVEMDPIVLGDKLCGTGLYRFGCQTVWN